LQSSIGLYFTDQGPTNTCLKIMLTSLAIDLPAGATNCIIEDSYVLPVAVDLLAVLPHAHYLAREMEGWATLPNGKREWLVWIKQWDFNWQGAYYYARPVALPQGSKLSMRFTYDNSTNNTRNPNHPPLPVTYGPQSSDEMAELWFQVLPHSQQDRRRLADDYENKNARVLLAADQFELRRDPHDARANTDMGMIRMSEGKFREAEAHFQVAIRFHPDFALAHYDYGLLLRREGRLDEARIQFMEDLRLDPKDYKAHGNLGAMALQQGDIETARAEFESALRINAQDALARDGLEQISQSKK
jgi:tetratricopeptide (TPR) repeat protein